MTKKFCEDCGVKIELIVNTVECKDVRIKQTTGGQEWKDGWRCTKCSRRKQLPPINWLTSW